MTENFLIFGPYSRSANSNLLLMQNHEGEIMLRDDYEKRFNITKETKTRCLWIYANTLKCIQDADSTPLKLMWGREEDEVKESSIDASVDKKSESDLPADE